MFPSSQKNIEKIIHQQKRRTDRLFQGPETGKLKGRIEHTYEDDSLKGGRRTKKFGGAGYRGKRPESKHILNLKEKALSRIKK